MTQDLSRKNISIYSNPLLVSLRHPSYGINILRRVFAHDKRSWFYFALVYQYQQYLSGLGPPLNYYEFGTGWGESLKLFSKSFKSFSKLHSGLYIDCGLYLFDSFEGMPDSTGEADMNPHLWKKGDFSHSEDEILSIAKANLPKGSSERVHTIKGYYAKSLTQALRDKLSKNLPGIVTIDCDYYSSTVAVLKWLKPLLRTGVLFYFDDTWAFGGSPDHGELRAIREFNSECDGMLTPFTLFPVDGPAGRVFIFSSKHYEYAVTPD